MLLEIMSALHDIDLTLEGTFCFFLTFNTGLLLHPWARLLPNGEVFRAYNGQRHLLPILQ